MDSRVIEAEFMTRPPMHQNGEDSNHFNEKETETLNQEPDFHERIKFNLSDEVNFIKNDSDESSVPKNMHPFEDPRIKDRIKKAERLIQKMNEDRSRIKEKIEERKFDRERILYRLKDSTRLSHRDSGLSQRLTWKRNELKYLRQALDKKLNAKNQSKGIIDELNSSVRTHDDLIRSLHNQVLHGSKCLAEEKQLLREIKWLAANTAVQERIEIIIIDIGEMKKSQQQVRAEIGQAKKEKAAIEKDIGSLHKELAKVYQKKHEADTKIFEMRKQNDITA